MFPVEIIRHLILQGERVTLFSTGKKRQYILHRERVSMFSIGKGTIIFAGVKGSFFSAGRKRSLG